MKESEFMGAQMVFVYVLHDASSEVETKLHKALGALPEFKWTGMHSTWETEDNDPGLAPMAAFQKVALKFGILAVAAGVRKWNFKVWGSQLLQNLPIEFPE
jgi:hypothetical protein